jgi:hypothetical protein
LNSFFFLKASLISFISTLNKKIIDLNEIIKFIYNHFFSFFPVKSAKSEIPLTAMTLNLIPGISPFDLPFLPKPATRT